MGRAGYPKLVAEWYNITRREPSTIELEYYLNRIPSPGGKVLELACGTGRLLVPIARRQIDITGTDASPYMLEMCKTRAADEGVSPKLHVQGMQDLALNEEFALVFIADGTFGLLTQDHDIRETLKRVRAHLRPGGCLAFDFDPPQSFANLGRWLGEWVQGSDGTVLAKRECRRVNKSTQILESLRIDEKWVRGALVESEAWTEQLSFHTPESIEALCREAGFARVEITKHFDHPQATDPELMSACCY